MFAANNNNDKESSSKSLGFAAIWMMFMVVGLAVGGTMVMRKFQNRFAVGLLTGVVVMMALNMFSLMVLFAGSAARARNDPDVGPVHSDEAAAAFAFFMSFLYAVFFGILIKHRHVIIKEDDAPAEESEAPKKAPPIPAAAAPPVSV